MVIGSYHRSRLIHNAHEHFDNINWMKKMNNHSTGRRSTIDWLSYRKYMWRHTFGSSNIFHSKVNVVVK